MNAQSTSNAAILFRSLHKAGDPLRLSNAWDAASAVIAEAAGATAIATTSAGIAWSEGVPDGDHLDREAAIRAVGRIVAAVGIPVSADIEGGYACSSSEVAATVSAILDTGAAGINIEDGNRTAVDAAERIRVARHAADAAGVPLFINARTDVFLAACGSQEEMTEEAIGRANRYVEAGADGIFVPGATSAESILTLVTAIPVPVNIMVGPGSLSVDELGRLGVARVSLGSGVAQAAYAVARRAAEELMSAGTYAATGAALDHGELNSLFAAQR